MKKFLMVLCCIFSLGFVLAGCSTVGMIQNDSNELIYNGNAGVTIGDYLYYGNAYNEVSSLSDLSGLNDVKKSSFLARINLENIDAKGQNFTPNGVEKVIKEEAIAQENQFMFAIGNYIYYLKPDIHRYTTDDGAEYQFGYSVLCSVKLDGNSNREIYTYQGEVTEIEVVKNGDNYYVVAFAGDKLFATKLNNGNGSTKVLGEGVTSVAIPNTNNTSAAGYTDEWNGKIYFTATIDDVTSVKEIAVDADDADEATIIGDKNGTVSFVYRQNDLIFYTYTSGSTTRTYYNNVKDLTGDYYQNDIIMVDGEHDFNSATISNVYVMQYGTSHETVIYTANSNVYYKNQTGSGRVTISDGTNDLTTATVVAIDDRDAFVMSSTGIYEVDFASLTTAKGDVSLNSTKTLITMTTIDTTLYGFDGEYIYFYAGLEALTDDEQELINDKKEAAGIEISDEEEDITTLDDGTYLYRVSVQGADGQCASQLLGITDYAERHSSYQYKA